MENNIEFKQEKTGGLFLKCLAVGIMVNIGAVYLGAKIAEIIS